MYTRSYKVEYIYSFLDRDSSLGSVLVANLNIII